MSSPKRRFNTMAALLGVMVLSFAGFAASTVTTASAAGAANAVMSTIGMKSNSAPAPTCPDPYVFSGKKAGCVPCPSGTAKDKATQTCKALPGTSEKCTTSVDANGTKTTVCATGVQATVGGAKASATALSSGSITILADDTVKGGDKVVQLHSKKCHFAATFKNSGEDANGHIFYFVDHNGTLCPSKASPTGWVKVSGGMTGRHCDNPAADMNTKYKVITGMIILVKSFHVAVPLRASVSLVLQNSCGHVGASALASATISLTSYVKSKGNVSINTFSKTVANLKASVSGSITCSLPPTTTVTTTPPSTTTTTTTTTPPPPSVSINLETINDIPAGQCRPVRVNVTSTAAGQVTIAPSKGSIGNVDCYTPSSERPSLTLPVSAGSNSYTVYVWAPSDAGATSDTLTATPIISGVDPSKATVSETYAISHPTRP